MNILWFRQISKKDVSLVGGKNASLGEMYSKLGRKISIPDAFCLTSHAYWYFLKSNKIDKELRKLFKGFNASNIRSLQKTGKQARSLILNGVFPKDLKKDILRNYRKLCTKYSENSVAVRSSATAEDMADASFAGQMETFLNVNNEKDVLLCVKKCMASLFTDRAIAYREEKGFKHWQDN